jgi:hypothetical protein
MFLAGLQFALGLVVGVTFLSGVATLAMIGATLFDRWRKKRRHLQYGAKARALGRATPQFRERAVFCFHFRTDHWLSKSDKTKNLRGDCV